MLGARRTLRLLVVVGLVGAPAVALNALCAGRSCVGPVEAAPSTPFCRLPQALRTAIHAGFNEERSPDILAVTHRPGLRSGTALRDAPWPSVADGRTRVPVVFWGTGVDGDAHMPPGARLDRIAPTLANILGLKRAHPEVRSGHAIDSVPTGERPRLAVVVALKGVDAAVLGARPTSWPFLRRLSRTGAASFDAVPGSLPLDPAALLTTIGTGGLPRQHGITGRVVRNDAGRATRAWSPRAPSSIIATLGDDLDEIHNQRARVGLVANDPADRGLIGGGWYLGTDRDEVVVRRHVAAQVRAADGVMRGGFGRDDVPDLLAVSMSGRIGALDRGLRQLVAAARAASGDSVVVVVTATGASARGAGGSSALDLARRLERTAGAPRLVEAVAAGGLFLDQRTLANEGIAEERLVDALLGLRQGRRTIFADVFPGIAVTFGRFC